MEPIIQLYTMRNEIAKDFDRTIKKVVECGFCGVEFAGEFGRYNAKELKAFMDDCGLYTLSAHVGFVQMKESLKANGWALNTEYFGEILHMLRDEFVPFVEAHKDKFICLFGNHKIKKFIWKSLGNLFGNQYYWVYLKFDNYV